MNTLTDVMNYFHFVMIAIHLNGIAFISVICWILQIVFLFLTRKKR